MSNKRKKSESLLECWKRRGLSQEYKGGRGSKLRNLFKTLCYSRSCDHTSLDIAALIKAGGGGGGTEVRDRKGFFDSKMFSAWECVVS